MKSQTKLRTQEWYRKKCVELAKKIVRIKANYKCAYCGVGEPQRRTHGSHVYGEGTYKNMSADIDNVLCLCAGHHLGFYKNTKSLSWHNNPIEMVEWFIHKYPKRHMDLKLRTQKIYKVNWEKKREELKLIYKSLNNT